ncbi:glycosyltransferase [Butyrivibrio sp. WCD2001]|uniref:glycosyltransferase n=1 Tax=Butyrivibrio sp. WCD2001 TaxID=1280681 RepID=UPI00041D698B|nr:glycosyltransferase [Butyrivibrio sp. WCD2001]
MKRILIDFTFYQSRFIAGSTFHGGGEYGNVIINELLQLNSDDYEFGLFLWAERNTDVEMLGKCKQKGWKIHPIMDYRNIVHIVRENNYDTIYSALPYNEVWVQVGKVLEDTRFVCTIHGLRMMELSTIEADEKAFYEGNDYEEKGSYVYAFYEEDNDPYRKLYGATMTSFKNCEIVAVSEFTKSGILFHFPEISEEKVHVLFSPQKSRTTIDEEDELLWSKKGITKGKYALLISAGIWYKNPLRGVLAYDRMFSVNSGIFCNDYKVVVCGVVNDSVFLSKIEHPERFIFLDYVSSDELELLYKYAHLFFYPSLNEGFGYPPVEAMKYGTICACSTGTSITEVCKDTVLYFNPYSMDEMCYRIRQSFIEDIREAKRKNMQKVLPELYKKQDEDLSKLIRLILE